MIFRLLFDFGVIFWSSNDDKVLLDYMKKRVVR